MSECVCGCGSELSGRQRKYASEECRKREARAAWIMKTYGLTLKEVDQIIEHQGGRCAVMGIPLKPGYHIDHDHVSGIVRGIVSAYANTRLIGRLRSAETAQRLADYLREPPAVEALGREVIAPGRPKKKRATKRTTRRKRA